MRPLMTLAMPLLAVLQGLAGLSASWSVVAETVPATSSLVVAWPYQSRQGRWKQCACARRFWQAFEGRLQVSCNPA
ncbi:hypothetical protein BA939_16535 [Rhizobium sp. S41]|nr:hypothetical protein BA939_16535 [Rhizobium sp. S41]